MLELNYSKERIGVVGLGYVGLPLAVEFSKKRNVLAFDIDKRRLSQLKKGVDVTLEVETNLLKSKNLIFSSSIKELEKCKVIIVTVPTPIDSKNIPDLGPLKKASKTVGKALNKGALVIFESTVYPGVTEDMCVPILEKESGLKYNEDFFCGYSPERINPGDNSRKLPSIIKVVSGSNKRIAEEVQTIYSEIIEAGTHKVSSIRVAEAAKVIENTQRDLNIALMNELSMLFNRLDIDTSEVLEAAATKWNFVHFKPGLVGGHCIGVDPYYLTHKAQSVGFNTEVIMAGRKTNDQMPKYVAKEVQKKLRERKIKIENSEILILGFSFKEDCNDIRNSKVVDIFNFFKSKGAKTDIYDPWVDINEAQKIYSVKCIKSLPKRKKYHAIIVAVAHSQFREISINKIRSFLKKDGIIYDVKAIFPREEVDGSL
tara:strand:- start:10038 stop:11321 length:1284 start_codon:yes stop_codon:yes gene_type:complete